MRKSKLISLLLALTLIITCFPAMVFADDEAVVDNGSEAEATAIEEEVEVLPEESSPSEAKNETGTGDGSELKYYYDDVNMYALVLTTNVYLSGSYRVPDYVICNGKNIPVTGIQYDAFVNSGLTSIHIPAGVRTIADHAVGYNFSNGSYYKISGFTIYGTNGTMAQAYARANGFNFRDLAAEEAARKEAARQGVRSSKIAKMKISSIKPAKKSFTVKWKKLSKKQIKKGKVNKYEIWVCKNKSFGPYDTSMHLISKKYGALKLKGATRKTTYYVKIRAVRYTGGVKYVGKWSKIKKVRTK